MIWKGVLLAAIVSLPTSVRAQPATQVNADLGAQFANTLGADSQPARAPTLGEVTAKKATLRAGQPPETPKLGDGPHLAAPPTIDSNPPKVEALGRRPVAVGGSTTHIVRAGHPHRATLVTFDPGQLHASSAIGQHVDDLARSWKTNLKWDKIMVDGYAVNIKLGQRKADEVRAYLVRHGVPGDYVTAWGHADEPGAAGSKIDLSVAICDDITIACRKAK